MGKAGIALCVAGQLWMATGALAAQSSLSALDIMQQFNLVVFGSASSTSDVDGRSFIGGSVNGGTYATTTLTTSSYPGLIVKGSASNVTVNYQGAVVGGSIANSTINNGSSAIMGSSSNTSYNGSGVTYVAGVVQGGNVNQKRLASLSQNASLQQAVTTTDSLTSSTVKSSLGSLSSQLSKLQATDSYTVNNKNKVTFNATANQSGIAVIDLTGSDSSTLTAFKEFAFNVDKSISTLIFNVDSTNVSIAANFLAGSSQKLASNIIWNFYNATQISLSNQFGGSILAPNASLTNYNEINGGVYVNSLTQRGAINLATFNGVLPAVPEPETYLLLGVGMALLCWRHQRRNSLKTFGMGSH
jgi:PEP-CTERM putative exosortase interaction domain